MIHILRFKTRKSQRGVTLLETILGVFILAIVALSVYRAFSVLFNVLTASQVRIAAATFANEQFEVIRNLPFVSVGTVGGIPPGILPQAQTFTKGNLSFAATTTVREIDDPFDGTIGGAPNDLSPADYKLVEIAMQCISCPGEILETFTFTGRVAPKALETASTNGALFVQAFDANGEPVAGATVQVVNTTVNPPVNVTDITDISGFLRIVDASPATQSYQVTVSKNGYSANRTYATSTSNPNPTKPHATVALQTVTQISFAIDRVSTLNVSSVTDSCAPVPSVNFTLSGAKLIGSNPDVLKFSQSYTTDSSGAKTISGLEWDNYALAFGSGGNIVAGTIPMLPLNLIPNVTQNFKIVTQLSVPRNLLVTVKDAATGLPLSNATVQISGGSVSDMLTTGRGFLRQTDWSNGSGQDLFSEGGYFDQDGNVAIANPAGDLTLMLLATSTHASAGILTSSTFDTGSASNFFNFTFMPISQPATAGPDAAKFQIATATTTNPSAWDFRGADGTVGTYYTASDTNVNAAHNGDRYLRYRTFLSTASTTVTPSVSDVAVTFASDCVPPGQVLFQGLPNDVYDITIVRSGYQTVNDVVAVSQSWQEFVVSMIP